MALWRQERTIKRAPRANAKPGQRYLISYDMMLKGNVAKRGRASVRQFGVSVEGSTRIVTSGDMVDQATFDALVAAKAIDPDRVKAALADNRPEPASATD